jgi:hypothetical protein
MALLTTGCSQDQGGGLVLMCAGSIRDPHEGE